MLSNDLFTLYTERHLDTVYRVALHYLKSADYAIEVLWQCLSWKHPQSRLLMWETIFYLQYLPGFSGFQTFLLML